MRPGRAALAIGLAVLVMAGCAKRIATVKEPVPKVQEERVSERPALPVAPAPSPSPPGREGRPSQTLPVPQKRPTVGEEGVATPVPPVMGGPPPQEVAKREAAQGPSGVTGGPQAAPSLHNAFFDFDRAVIRDDAKEPLAANAKRLAADPGLKVLVEGHADERGSVDYNLVLGEKRAKAVKEYLAALGVDAGRIQTVSFGKERPFCREQTEDCYQQNRRGHFVILTR